MIRRLFKWMGVLLLGLIVMIGAIYASLAGSEGETAASFAYFEEKNGARPLVIAHRGGAGLAPENTLAAFENAVALGVDVLELDVRGTADGEIVVLHDARVDRTTDGAGAIAEMTLAEVKKLNAGLRFTADGGQTYPFRERAVRVPTLEEVFAAFPQMKFNIEPKQQTPSLVEPLCRLIGERKLTDKVVVASFNQTLMDEFRAKCPAVATSAGPSDVTRFLTLYKTGLSESFSPQMQALQIPENAGWMEVVTREFIEAAHKRNLKVHVWTVNQPADMRRLLEMGVDGIMTDYPDRLLDVLGRKH